MDNSSDETGIPINDGFFETSDRSSRPILVINETGQVLYVNPVCKEQFNISQNKHIQFDLEKGGIRVTLDDPSLDSSSLPLIPYSEIRESVYKGENCFVVTLEHPLSSDKTSGMPLENILDSEYQQMPGAIYQALDDEQLTIFQITNGITTLLGYTPEDLVNNLKFSFISLVHPEDIELVQKGRQDAIQTNNLFELTYRVRHINGEYKTVRDQGRVLKTDSGMVQAIEGWLMPIPGSKNIEEELVESESRLKFFIDASPDAVVYADLKGEIKLANPQFSRMLGISEGINLSGVNVLSFLAQDDRDPFEKDLSQSLSNENSYIGYYHAKTVSGQVIPIELNIRMLTSPKGKRTGLIGVIRNIIS